MTLARALLLAAGLAAPAAALAQANHYVLDEVVAFEDVPDGASDADQNDLVVRANKRCRVDAGGALVAEEHHLTALAAGARLDSALVLTFGTVPDSATVDDGTGPQPLAVDASGRAVLAADAGALFTGAPEGFVNTEPDAAIADGIPLVVEATWSAGPTVGGDCPPADLSLERSGVVVDGASTLSNGQPLRAHLPADWQVPSERVPLGQAYPEFLDWLADDLAGCSGTDCTSWDWYERPGADVIPRPSLQTTAPLPSVDTCDDGAENQDERWIDCGGDVCGECVFATCRQYVDRDADRGDGGYTLDPLGTGDTVDVYCDITNGGWTLLAVGGTGTGCPAPPTAGSDVWDRATDTDLECTYLPAPHVEAIAALSTDVRLQVGSSFGAWSTTVTSTGTQAIEALRTGGTWHDGAYTEWSANPWRWQWDTGSSSCVDAPGATGWPDMFHGCGYADAVHWLHNGMPYLHQPIHNSTTRYGRTATWAK